MAEPILQVYLLLPTHLQWRQQGEHHQHIPILQPEDFSPLSLGVRWKSQHTNTHTHTRTHAPHIEMGCKGRVQPQGAQHNSPLNRLLLYLSHQAGKRSRAAESPEAPEVDGWVPAPQPGGQGRQSWFLGL